MVVDFIMPLTSQTIPAILTRETSMLTRTYIEDDPFLCYIKLMCRNGRRFFKEGVPQMNAYIATTPKRYCDNRCRKP